MALKFGRTRCQGEETKRSLQQRRIVFMNYWISGMGGGVTWVIFDTAQTPVGEVRITGSDITLFSIDFDFGRDLKYYTE